MITVFIYSSILLRTDQDGDGQASLPGYSSKVIVSNDSYTGRK